MALSSHLGSAESRFGKIGFAVPEPHVVVTAIGQVIEIIARYTPRLPTESR